MPVMAMRNEWHVKKRISISRTLSCPMDMCEYSKSPPLSPIMSESFRESQEWSLARDVQDVRVGIVGSDSSNKTAFVRRFVQGPDLMNCSSVRENSDCRVKCKLQVDGKWKLLLLREETGTPTKQLVLWADIILLVFSYADEQSLLVLGDCYKSIQDYRQENYDIPILMVGVQDSKGKKVKDADVRKINIDQLDKCQIMDVNLGSSNESVFLQACRLVAKVQDAGGLHIASETLKKFKGVPSGASASPMQSRRMRRKSGIFNTNKQYVVTKPQGETIGPGRDIPKKMGEVKKKTTGLNKEWRKKYLVLGEETLTYYPSIQDFMAQSHGKSVSLRYITVKEPGKRPPTASATFHTRTVANHKEASKEPSKEPSPIGSECSTGSPTSFTSSLVTLNTNISHNGVVANGTNPISLSIQLQRSELSSSDRCINKSSSPPPKIFPFPAVTMQNHSSSAEKIHHERTLSDITKQEREISRHERASSTDGLLQCMSPDDYLSDDYDVHRNSLPRLGKQPGVRYMPLTKSASSQNAQLQLGDKSSEEREFTQCPIDGTQTLKDRERRLKPATSFKRKHQRQRSWGGSKILDEQDVQESLEFTIVSLDSKRWIFEANTKEEKDEWVKSINSQIKTTLSLATSDKRMSGVGFGDKKAILEMRGNDRCADCGSPNPLWASLNFGCLLCIQCSGIHRNFGSHISRIRSLELDEWSLELIAVMLSVGNELCNSIWEMNVRGRHKPMPHSSREEKETWIRSKYVHREFIPPLPPANMILSERLMECVISEDGPDMEELLLLLAHCTPEDINVRHPSRNYSTALHYACTLGRQVVVQLLVWNSADVNILDQDGRSSLAYCRYAGHHDCAEILLMNGTNEYSAVDSPDLVTNEVFHQSAAV